MTPVNTISQISLSNSSLTGGNSDSSSAISYTSATTDTTRSSNDTNSIPENAVKIMEFLRSNIIGNRCLIETPFHAEQEIVYADYTASGRSLRFVEEYMSKVVLPTYANTHTEASATGAQTTHLREEARDIIHKALNAPKEDYTVLFTGSGSTAAIHKMFHVLGIGIPEYAEKKWNLGQMVPENERPIIFVSHMEHHSNELPWRHSLARCIVIGESRDGTPDLDHLERELIKYSAEQVPMIGSFSAGSNVTGIRAPVRSICKLLHSYGAYAFFDYAGVGAYVEVDIGSDGDESSIDAAFFSPHKFIGGPGASGVLVARTKLFHGAFDIKTVNASAPGGGTVGYVFRHKHTFAEDIAYREDAGTPGVLQDIRAGLAFKVKEMMGSESIEVLENMHTMMALNAWGSNPSIALMGADRISYHTVTRRVPIFSFNIISPVKRFSKSTDTTNVSLEKFFPMKLSNLANIGALESSNEFKIPLHYNFVIALLNDVYGIQGRGGCSCAGPYSMDLFDFDAEAMPESVMSCFDAAMFKPGWARVNLNYFIGRHEVHFITEAVNQISKYGWILLPLYVQDVKSGKFIHHTKINDNGDEKVETMTCSLNDLKFETSADGANEVMKASYNEPTCLLEDRERSSYIKVLNDAKEIYKRELRKETATRPSKILNFTSESASYLQDNEVLKENIWWLLPEQAERHIQYFNLKEAKKKNTTFIYTGKEETKPVALTNCRPGRRFRRRIFSDHQAVL
jgi:selenocysteine lyase/cysteine desulfurase